MKRFLLFSMLFFTVGIFVGRAQNDYTEFSKDGSVYRRYGSSKQAHWRGVVDGYNKDFLIVPKEVRINNELLSVVCDPDFDRKDYVLSIPYLSFRTGFYNENDANVTALRCNTLLFAEGADRIGGHFPVDINCKTLVLPSTFDLLANIFTRRGSDFAVRQTPQCENIFIFGEDKTRFDNLLKYLDNCEVRQGNPVAALYVNSNLVNYLKNSAVATLVKEIKAIPEGMSIDADDTCASMGVKWVVDGQNFVWYEPKEYLEPYLNEHAAWKGVVSDYDKSYLIIPDKVVHPFTGEELRVSGSDDEQICVGGDAFRFLNYDFISSIGLESARMQFNTLVLREGTLGDGSGNEDFHNFYTGETLVLPSSLMGIDFFSAMPMMPNFPSVSNVYWFVKDKKHCESVLRVLIERTTLFDEEFTIKTYKGTLYVPADMVSYVKSLVDDWIPNIKPIPEGVTIESFDTVTFQIYYNETARTARVGGFKPEFADTKSLKIPAVIMKNGIPYAVDAVGNFSNNTSIESVEIAEGVKQILPNCFAGCSNLSTVVFPSSIETIDNYAFMNCVKLSHVDLPANLNSLGHNVFLSCTGLQSFSLMGGKLTSIPTGAFKGCSSLKEINLPEGVESVGKEAFNGCDAVTNITLPSTITSLGTTAFNINNENVSIITMSETGYDFNYFVFNDNLYKTAQVTVPSDVARSNYATTNWIRFKKLKLKYKKKTQPTKPNPVRRTS